MGPLARSTRLSVSRPSVEGAGTTPTRGRTPSSWPAPSLRPHDRPLPLPAPRAYSGGIRDGDRVPLILDARRRNRMSQNKDELNLSRLSTKHRELDERLAVLASRR